MHQMISAVDLSNSTSFEVAAVMKFFEFLKQLAGTSFDDRTVRLPGALPKAGFA
jgi:hypothetical protein